MKVISWNLLRLTGAEAEDVAALVDRYRPDLLLLQEATQDLERLPHLVGGTIYREPLERRIYGLAMWSPHHLPKPRAFRLPVSQVPGRVPPRLAQVVTFNGVSFANVHLSHGQFLNRYQLMRIANALTGPAAIIGDYNAVGPITLPGFKDIGPRQPTHSPATILSFRLDRCMARGLRCAQGRVLARGPSDHHPILLELQAAPYPQKVPTRTRVLRANIERLLAAVQDAPVRARLRQRWSRVQQSREHSTRWSA